MLTWLALIVYCSPWLGLVTTQPLLVANVSGLVKCDFVISRNFYLAISSADVALFYVLPLSLSVVLYTRARVCITMYNSMRKLEQTQNEPEGAVSHSELKPLTGTEEVEHEETPLSSINIRIRYFSQQLSSSPFRRRSSTNYAAGRRFHMQKSHMAHITRSRFQVVKMLVVVVTCFALLWLPYRGLLVYNSLVGKPWLNQWYMLFAKNLVVRT